MKPASSLAAAEARKFDRDRFLCALFAPAERREALFALLAFNAQVARIPELVHEPILGSVRLQWWRETLDAIYSGAPPAHEVAAALARAVAAHGLTRGHLDRLLDAREFDLGDSAPEDIPALVAYAEATSAGLTLLALEILAPPGAASDEAAAAGRDLGIAWGLTGLIRAVPFHARRRRLYLPKSLLEREGVRVADVLDLRGSAPLRAAVREIAGLARGHLASARQHAAPDWAVPALLSGVLADSYLARLERAGFDPFASAIEGGHLARQLRLWLAAKRGKF